MLGSRFIRGYTKVKLHHQLGGRKKNGSKKRRIKQWLMKMMPQPDVTSTVQFSPGAARCINAWIKSALLEQEFLQKQEVVTKMYVQNKQKKTLAQQLRFQLGNRTHSSFQPPIDSLFNGSQFLINSMTSRLSLFIKKTYKSKKRPLQATLKNRRRRSGKGSYLEL